MQGLKPSQALMRVKKMLPDTSLIEQIDSPYICDNIDSLWRNNDIDEGTRTVLKNHIRNLLNNAHCLKEWLLINEHITQQQWEADLVNSSGKISQRTRQLWLDDMILHFKSKGM